MLARDTKQTQELRDYYAAAAGAIVQIAASASSLVDRDLFTAFVKSTGFSPQEINDGSAQRASCEPVQPKITAALASGLLSASVSWKFTGGGATSFATDDMIVFPNAGQVLSSLGRAGDAIVVVIDGKNVVVPDSGSVIASGGGNFKVVDKAGNVIASGGNVIASGGGNVVIPDGASVIASGGGNFEIKDALGRVIASGGGNLISTRGNAFW